MNNISEILNKLSKSKFRSSFHLNKKMKDYVNEKGIDLIREHALEIISKRIAPKYIPNDGKQTPTKNHPVFIAQHSTATCCRGCLEKWHHIPKGKELTKEEIDYIVKVVVEWVKREVKS